MPYTRQNAPATTPDTETIESLLGERNTTKKATERIKPLQELSDVQKARTGLVRLGKRNATVQGDPYGIWCSWAGNIAHPDDERMLSILMPIFAELKQAITLDTEEVSSIRSVLELIPSTPLGDIPSALSGDKTHRVLRDIPEELVIAFELGKKSVRLMQCRDLDVTDEKSYAQSTRARTSQANTDAQLDEPLMAQMWTKYVKGDESINLEFLPKSREGSDSMMKSKAGKRAFSKLRMDAQEHYWLQMTSEQREATRQRCIAGWLDDDLELNPQLDLVKQNWPSTWTSEKRHPDYFRAYVVDGRAAQNVWEHAKEDIVIVLDKNRQVVFANVETLAQTLFGSHTTQLLERCLDMWSFFVPLPSPESARHVVDSYIRKLHPELDPSRATVGTLPNAKVCVAHYGWWAMMGDPHGRRIKQTRDSAMNRTEIPSEEDIYPGFCGAALAKAAAMIRFLVQPLDAKYYRECVEIMANVDQNKKLPTDDPDEFISLFALGVNGFTQRHKDANDFHGGLAGLCTLGNYTGGNLCIPQLNLNVSYQPGACAVIRGTALDHLVQDFPGTRFFLIGSNHESVKRNVWRKLGRLPPLVPTLKRKREEADEGPSPSGSNGDSDEEEDDLMETTCVNEGDDNDEDIEYSNRELHGAGALNDTSSEDEST